MQNHRDRKHQQRRYGLHRERSKTTQPSIELIQRKIILNNQNFVKHLYDDGIL